MNIVGVWAAFCMGCAPISAMAIRNGTAICCPCCMGVAAYMLAWITLATVAHRLS